MENVNKKIETYLGCDDKKKIGSTIDDFVGALSEDENLVEGKFVAGRDKDGKIVYHIQFVTFVGDLNLVLPEHR